MPTTLELLRSSGITTGKVTQLPPTLGQKVDYSGISQLKYGQSLVPTAVSQPATPTPVSPMSGQQIQSMKWGEALKPTTPVPQPVSAPSTQTLATVGSAVTTASVLTAGNPVGTALAAGVLINLALLNANVKAVGSLVAANAGVKKAEQVAATAEARYQLAVQNAQKANPINTKGSSSSSTPTGGLGGQTVGVDYGVYLTYDVNQNGSFLYSVTRNGPFSITAPLQGISGPQAGSNRQYVVITDASGSREITLASGTDLSIGGFNSQVERADGQPDTPTPNTGFTPSPDTLPKEKPVNAGASPNFFPWLPVIQVGNDPLLAYKDAYGTGSPSFDNRPFKEPEKPLFAPALATAPTPTPTATPTPLPSAVSSPATGSNANPSPVSTTPTNPSISPSQAPNGLTSPLTPPTVAKPQGTPNTPPSHSLESIGLGIVGLGLATGSILTGIDFLKNLNNQINNQTKPEAQQINAKQGVCDAMQPQQCGFEGVKQATTEATAPIKDQAIANGGAISSIANLLATIWQFLQNQIGKILSILNNSVVDRTLAVMNLATNIHNAAMLTRDIGETLGSVIDNVINLSPLRFTNSEGSQVQFTDFIGSNFRAFMVSVLGADNYTSLVLNWQKANTIYHSAMGVLNTTQSMIDPISSAVEYGMENVSKIGNSLKEDGVVSENSYPAMDETIRARRVNRFERLNDTLEGAENIASNLSSVTSSAVSIKEDYKQLREDSKDLRDKAAAFNTTDETARAELKAQLPTEITPITLAPAPAEDEATP